MQVHSVTHGSTKLQHNLALESRQCSSMPWETGQPKMTAWDAEIPLPVPKSRKALWNVWWAMLARTSLGLGLESYFPQEEAIIFLMPWSFPTIHVGWHLDVQWFILIQWSQFGCHQFCSTSMIILRLLETDSCHWRWTVMRVWRKPENPEEDESLLTLVLNNQSPTIDPSW